MIETIMKTTSGRVTSMRPPADTVMTTSKRNVTDPWFWFSPEEYAARRARVFAEIGPRTCAVVQGAGPVRGFEAFRQSNDFFYLCGLEIPRCLVLLDGRTGKTTLFAPHRDARPSSEGDPLGAEDAEALIALTGVDEVGPVEELAARLSSATAIATPHAPAESRLQARDSLSHAAKLIAEDPWDAMPTREEQFISLLRKSAPGAEIKDLTPVLDEMRLVKSRREIAVLRRAGRLSALAVVEAMRSAKPGRLEYELGAIAEYVYQVNGARGVGYRPIIPNGPNVWFGHYTKNDQPLVDGELILMDGAPEVCNYTSDIGRMFPVNRRYSPLQRELYGFMVEYHKALLERIRPGALPQAILAEAAEEMAPVIERTRFSKPIYEEAARRTLPFRGHLSHPVGMAVHDVGRYFERPMPVGLVITVDPQMWIPEEKLYIRVEDTIAVTESGIEVFTKDAPLELDDVEALMREEGMLDKVSLGLDD